MNSSELRDYATVVAATVALLVFFVNSYLQVRSRRIANLARFIEAHQRLFTADGYIAKNILAFENGTLTRDFANHDMEAQFHLMLLEIEQLAILANNHAVPRLTQVYMFGSYTRQILKVLTEKERNNMFWELAIDYLDALAKDTSAYEKLSHRQRERYWQ